MPEAKFRVKRYDPEQSAVQNGALLGIVTLDAELSFRHQYVRSCGSNIPRVTGLESRRGPSGVLKANVCLSHRASSRSGKSVRECDPRDSVRLSAPAAMPRATSTIPSSSTVRIISRLNTPPV